MGRGVGAHPGRVGRWTGGLGQRRPPGGGEEEREGVRFGRGVQGGGICRAGVGCVVCFPVREGR